MLGALTQANFICADLPGSQLPAKLPRTMYSPPLPHHLRIAPDFTSQLRLNFAVPQRMILLGMRADHYPWDILGWWHKRFQPFVIEYKAGHYDEGDLLDLDARVRGVPPSVLICSYAHIAQHISRRECPLSGGSPNSECRMAHFAI